MYKAWILGAKHEIMGFRALGFELAPVESVEEASQTLLRLARQNDVAWVLITETLAESAKAACDEFRALTEVPLVCIPNHEGTRGYAFEEVRKTVERSLGVDLLGKAQKDAGTHGNTNPTE
jgi:V/A-type H+-transporting ATPase subunit F